MITVYIAGPMTGIQLWNFPAFDEARDRLEEQGYIVISPADLDRSSGFDETKPVNTWRPEFLNRLMRNSLAALAYCDHIYFLPGWENSTGAKMERTMAEYLGITEIK